MTKREKVKGFVTSVRSAFVTQKVRKKVTGMLIDEPQFQKLFNLDGWNDVVIVAEGNHIRHYLNGRQVIDFVNHDPVTVRKKGVIGLQLHGGKPMWTEFKDIRLKLK